MTATNRSIAFSSVDSIGKQEINAIAKDPFFTHGWLKTLETANLIEHTPVYVTVYEDKKLAAFTPCFIERIGKNFSFGPNISFLINRILKIGKPLRLWKNDFLLCYSPYCFRTKVSMGLTSDNNLVYDELLKKIDDVCKKENTIFSVFPFVSEFDKPLMHRLEKDGYNKLYYITTLYVDVFWSTFEEYLQSLKTRVRQNARREMRHLQKSNIEIEEVNDLTKHSEILSNLCSNLLSKYGQENLNLFSIDFYDALNSFSQKELKVFIAKKDEVIIGFSLSLFHDGILDVVHCGFNYDLIDKTDYVYFSLVYYEPIKWAINNGAYKVYYRIKTETVKRRRGCKPEKMYAYVKCNNKPLNYLMGLYLNNRNNQKPLEHFL